MEMLQRLHTLPTSAEAALLLACCRQILNPAIYCSLLYAWHHSHQSRIYSTVELLDQFIVCLFNW